MPQRSLAVEHCLLPFTLRFAVATDSTVFGSVANIASSLVLLPVQSFRAVQRTWPPPLLSCVANAANKLYYEVLSILMVTDFLSSSVSLIAVIQ